MPKLNFSVEQTGTLIQTTFKYISLDTGKVGTINSKEFWDLYMHAECVRILARFERFK